MATKDASGPPVRLVMRLLLRFMIAAIPSLSRWHGGDLVRGVVFLATAQATRPRPPQACRPIRVYGLAASLALPYETTRRRVNALAEDGLVVRREDQAILVPEVVLRDGAFPRYADEVYALFLDLARGLRAIGLDFDTLGRTEPVAEEPQPFETPDRAIRSLVLDFVLRMLECGVAVHENDMQRALVFTAIMSANAEPYTDALGEAWDYARLDQSPPDALRRPISVAHIADRLGIPYETTRRTVMALLADGDVVRVGNKGVINPQVSPRDAALHKSGVQVMSRFVQFVGDLRRLGFDFRTLSIQPRRAA